MKLVLDKNPTSRKVAAQAARDYLKQPLSAAWVPAEPKLSPALRVYRLDFDKTLAGMALRKAKRYGWRYFLLEGDSGVSAAIHVAKIKGKLRTTHISHGDSVLRAVAALVAIEDEAGDDSVQVSIIDAPELYFEAVWAVAEDRAWVIPIETASSKEVVPRLDQDAMEAYLAEVAAEHLADGAAPEPIPTPS